MRSQKHSDAPQMCRLMLVGRAAAVAAVATNPTTVRWCAAGHVRPAVRGTVCGVRSVDFILVG
eukprot:365632-Chlamydomonas_euryale.AAC.10